MTPKTNQSNKRPIIGATECEWYHEDYCIAKHELGEDFECDGMKVNGLLVECHNTNDDLVQACAGCDYAPADADFPYNDYCKKCAKEQIEDVK